MEKRFRRVQRWLERCIEACRKEKWTNAVADVECARAELEAARDELWSAVSEGASNEGKGFSKRLFPLSVRSAVLAVAVIMSAAIPLSTGTGPVPLERESDTLSLEWVTADEKSLLTALRKNLSDKNSARSEADGNTSDPVVAGEQGRQVARAAVSSKTAVTDEKKQRKPERQPSEKTEVTLDEILSLYEIGHRALRSDSVVIQETNR